ncbi:MAG: ABC transporter ATP-binding protein [Planctomycetota bacterium]|nr:MAG: ABC transporter ATP-binding protein [Planctomycetota bacterium]
MSEPVPLVRVRGLEKRYPRQRVDAPWRARLLGRLWGWTGALDEWELLNEGLPVLKGIDLDVYADEILAIVGPSGAGKSTLLHLIGALDRPSAGAVVYEGQDLGSRPAAELDRWRNLTVGFVFQFYHLFPDLDALENVLVPAQVAHSVPSYLGRRREFAERARHLLERVGLGDRAHHRPSQLSGGEQQRVAIARALLLEPKLLLCDEPTGNLDRKTGEHILELLWELKASQGQTYVIVTHDDRLARRADRVALLEDGLLIDVVEQRERDAGAGPAPEEPSALADEAAS